MPPVQAAREQEAHVLEHVHRRMAQGLVVGRGHVPAPDRPDVQDHCEGRMRQHAGAALELAHRACQRTQQHLREPEDRQDRHQVEQQHVLEHVHRQELVGERVQR